ncbi:unnamed protein product [Protopolystoma xenopodis]|uniref:Uncharacterized protein n=1 Tax=Protopolystoma xenopodis TaxID=117903 RepID=A0A3S5BNB5_9PLAT|nr:unnamed protein product [Protopolystoma xenopodis]
MPSDLEAYPENKTRTLASTGIKMDSNRPEFCPDVPASRCHLDPPGFVGAVHFSLSLSLGLSEVAARIASAKIDCCIWSASFCKVLIGVHFLRMLAKTETALQAVAADAESSKHEHRRTRLVSAFVGTLVASGCASETCNYLAKGRGFRDKSCHSRVDCDFDFAFGLETWPNEPMGRVALAPSLMRYHLFVYIRNLQS